MLMTRLSFVRFWSSRRSRRFSISSFVALLWFWSATRHAPLMGVVGTTTTIVEDDKKTLSPPPPPTTTTTNNNVVLVSTDFLDACTHGHQEIVAQLLQEHPDWVNGRSPDGETCLHVAGIYGQADVTKLVLEFSSSSSSSSSSSFPAAADPNIRTTFAQGLRMHPLSWNVYAGHVDTARILLEHGADPNLDFDAAASSSSSSTEQQQQQPHITVMDVVLQMLEHDNNDKTSDSDPYMERYRKMKELLLSYNAKTYNELLLLRSTNKEPEL